MVGQNLLKDPDMYYYIYEVAPSAALEEIMHYLFFLFIDESGLLVLVGSSLD